MSSKEFFKGDLTMKTLENIYEWIIIVLAIAILVIPEIAYSCILRARDKLEDMAGEL